MASISQATGRNLGNKSAIVPDNTVYGELKLSQKL
jgi:hypothetical protein